MPFFTRLKSILVKYEKYGTLSIYLHVDAREKSGRMQLMQACCLINECNKMTRMEIVTLTQMLQEERERRQKERVA